MYWRKLSSILFVAATTTAAATSVAPTSAVATTTTVTSSVLPTATVLSSDISFAMIGKNISVPQIPNCSTTGTLRLISGGYTTNESDIATAQDFFSDGFLEFEAEGVSANVSLDLSFLPGFSLANFKVPIFVKHLFTLPLGDFANVDVVFEIGIPVSIALNSQVNMFAGFTLTIPDGSNIYLDIGNPNNTRVTGFSDSKLTPLPFDLSAPNLSLTAITGLEMTMTANASTNTKMLNTTAKGSVVATLDLPMLNTTVTQLSNVNAKCETPKDRTEQSFDHAVNVLSTAQFGLDMTGKFAASIAGMEEDWSPPDVKTFNHSFPLPSQCMRWSPEATGLVAADAPAPSSSGTAKGQDAGAGKNAAARGAPSLLAMTVMVAALVAST